MNITNEFWDFIKANVPNYDTREDVLRQSNLQIFIDQDDDTHVKGITHKEAILLRDNIVHQLLAEAVSSFSTKLPLAIPGECSLRDYAETLVNIAYESGVRQFRPSHDSRETISSVINWADEFSRIHEDTDWSEVDYLDTLLDFTEKKLHTAPHMDDSATDFTIASLNRAALKRHDYDTTSLSDRDMYELAGLMGDSYCDSSQFSHDVHTACEMFGLTENSTCSYVLVQNTEETDKIPDDLGYPSSEAQSSNARYIPESDYIRLFGKVPEPNSYYEPVRWPESQKYMPEEDEGDDSTDALNELINDEKGLEEFGGNAYWIAKCNLK